MNNETGTLERAAESKDGRILSDALSAMHDIPIIRQKLAYVMDRLHGGNTVNVLEDEIYDETIEWFLNDIVKIVNRPPLPRIPSRCVNCPYESLGMCYYEKEPKNCTKMDSCPKKENENGK